MRFGPLGIHPQQVASAAQSAARLRRCGAADNFRNLFELPVLFYLAVLMAFTTAHVSAILLALAWVFVALRVVHSVIHSGYNTVMHRFKAYAAGAAVLCAMWIVLAIQLAT